MLHSLSVPVLPTPDKWNLGETIFQGRCGSLHQIKVDSQSQSPYFVAKVSSAESAKNEAYFLSNLDHPNILNFKGKYEKEGKQILLLERALGSDVCTQLLRFRSFPKSVAKHIFHQAVESVKYLHSLNIAHRDIKLENFLIMNRVESTRSLSSCLVKLADFEFAIECPKGVKLKLARGTLEYNPPEVLLGEYCPFAKDCWSLGVCLFILLVGEFPGLDGESFETATQVIESRFHKKKDKKLKDLLLGIFKEEDKRLTVDQISTHPWLLESNKKIEEEEKSVFFQRLKKISLTRFSISSHKKS